MLGRFGRKGAADLECCQALAERVESGGSLVHGPRPETLLSLQPGLAYLDDLLGCGAGLLNAELEQSRVIDGEATKSEHTCPDKVASSVLRRRHGLDGSAE